MAKENENNPADEADKQKSVDNAQADLESFVRAQMEAALSNSAAAGEESSSDAAAPEETEKEPVAAEASAEEPRAEETPAEEAAAPEETEKEPVAAAASTEEARAEASAEKPDMAKAQADLEAFAQAEMAAASNKAAAQAAKDSKADNEESEATAGEGDSSDEAQSESSDGAPESPEDDLEKWAEEQLLAMEAEGVLDDDSDQEGAVATSVEGAAEDSASPDVSDMEAWAAAQLAEMGEDDDEEKPGFDDPVEAESSDQDDRPVAGTVVSPNAGIALRPLHAAVFLLAAMLPVGAMGWFLSTRYTVTHTAAKIEMQQALDDMEKRLSTQNATKLLTAEEQAARTTAEDVNALVRVGNGLYAEGKFAEARRVFQSAIEKDVLGRFTDEAHYGLGLCLLKAKDDAAALEEFRTVVMRFPGSRKYARASMEAARMYMQQKSYVHARRLLYQMIGCRYRFEAEDQECVEWARYAIGKCFEEDANTRDAADLITFTAAGNIRPQQRGK